MGITDAVSKAVELATEIAAEKTSPYDGAKALWALHTELQGLTDSLLVFVALASEWEDAQGTPDEVAGARTKLDTDIRFEADRFRAAFGP